MKIERKPEWLRKKANPGDQAAMRRLLAGFGLNTVCQQAMCPNISECYSCGQATFLILGCECTRRCTFCNVDKTAQPAVPDPSEAVRVARAVQKLRLHHVVITSPTRDDLPDGGADQFAATVRELRALTPKTVVELLIPDFMGSVESLETVISSGPDIIGHNVETVPRMYHVRSGSDYLRSLKVIRVLADSVPKRAVKSGLMLGLGESEAELLAVMSELYSAGCRYLSLGQYLAPSRNHQPVLEYISPEKFEQYREQALAIGFIHVESGPYVRSSYHAGKYL